MTGELVGRHISRSASSLTDQVQRQCLMEGFVWTVADESSWVVARPMSFSEAASLASAYRHRSLRIAQLVAG
jgi:hypothetical protein